MDPVFSVSLTVFHQDVWCVWKACSDSNLAVCSNLVVRLSLLKRLLLGKKHVELLCPVWFQRSDPLLEFLDLCRHLLKPLDLFFFAESRKVDLASCWCSHSPGQALVRIIGLAISVLNYLLNLLNLFRVSLLLIWNISFYRWCICASIVNKITFLLKLIIISMMRCFHQREKIIKVRRLDGLKTVVVRFQCHSLWMGG